MRRVLFLALSLSVVVGCHGKSDDDDDDKVATAPARAPAASAPAASAPASAAATTATPAPEVPSVDNGVVYKAGAKPEWVKVAAGKFHYGCEPQDQECGEPEKSSGSDETGGKFDIMKTEVTVEQYAACVAAKKCDAPKPGAGGACNWQIAGKEKHPINCVTRDEAVAYCTFAGARLPTGKEWEWACKVGGSRIYPWGNDRPDEKRALWGQQARTTAAVGSHPTGASKLGLLDMAGNVWEWTADAADEMTEVRGGAFSTQAYTLHCSRRGKRPAADRDDWIGLRCVK